MSLLQSMKRVCLLIAFTFVAIGAGSTAQAQDKNWTREIRLKEDSLALMARTILEGREAAARFRADSQFTRTLVRALRMPFSIRYPFDSLRNISRLYAPDSSFRIFTWQVARDEQVFRRHGAIQMNTKDGSLKLFPLIDRAQLILDQTDTVTGNDWWIGSIYYKIIQRTHQGRNYYTLLGYDEHSMRSTRKRIEVLTFDEAGKPRFGGPFFSFQEDTLKKPVQSRFWIEYKKDGKARIQFDEELDIIIYDHLISETNEPKKKFTYIPDGDYEGFKWKNGKWVHIDKVFDFKLKDGEAPIITPMTENKLGGGKKGQ